MLEELYDMEIHESTGVYLQKEQLFDLALEELKELGIVNIIEDKFGPDVVSFSTDFSDDYHLLRLSEIYPKSVYARVKKFGVEWLASAIDEINSKLSDLDNSETEIKELESLSVDEDIWEPLPIDRSAPEYEETIAGIEKAIQEIGADNGFSAKYPDERDNIIEHANATLKSVKEGKATKGQIKQNLIATGSWIMEKFAGSALGALGKSLVEWAIKLLSLGG